MKPLRAHFQAKIEFDDAARYYESRLTGLGEDFEAEVKACFLSIRQAPARFPFHKRTAVRRCLVHRFPFVIYFQELDDVIFVISVAHAKRRPDYWARRID